MDAMKAYGRAEVEHQSFLFSASFRLHTRASNPWAKNPWYPLKRRVGGPQICSARLGDEKNILSLPGIEKLFLDFLGTNKSYTTEEEAY
jgi:hypothetical protein